MRYFRNKTPSLEEVLHEHGTSSSTSNKSKLQKANFTSVLKTLLFLLITIVGLIGFDQLWKQIPEPSGIALFILYAILLLFLFFFGLIVSVLIAMLVIATFSVRGESALRRKKLAVLTKLCEDLKAYYGLCDPCLVTKCYDASDKTFVDHDVCLFVAGEELRITTNLKNGYVYGDRDLGCYAFTREEIVLSETEQDHFLATELKADGAEFLLGIRAKKFIETRFLM